VRYDGGGGGGGWIALNSGVFKRPLKF